MSTSSILVFGATGGVGSEVTRQLVAKRAVVTAAVRDVDKARNKLPPDVLLVKADYADTTSIQQAAISSKADKAFLYFNPHMSTVLPVLKAGGLRHLVFLSSALVDLPMPANAIKDWHAQAEQAIIAAGFTYTFLRADAFSSNPHNHWKHSIALSGVVKTPYPDAPVGVIAIEDIAAVAVDALTSHHLDNKSVNIVGAEVLTSRQQVAVVAEVLGKPITVQALSDAEHIEELSKHGIPMPIIQAQLVYGKWRLEKGGDLQAPADRTIKGTTKLREYTQKHLSAFDVQQ